MTATMVDSSVLWITIPPILLLSTWFARKWYLARRLKVHGIGKGAPGFQTGVRQLRVTPEIAARLRRGEQVSPEEIAAAVQEAEENAKRPPLIEKNLAQTTASSEQNEWLPENLTSQKRRVKGKRK